MPLKHHQIFLCRLGLPEMLSILQTLALLPLLCYLAAGHAVGKPGVDLGYEIYPANNFNVGPTLPFLPECSSAHLGLLAYTTWNYITKL